MCEGVRQTIDGDNNTQVVVEKTGTVIINNILFNSTTDVEVNDSNYYYPAYNEILNNPMANKILRTLWKNQQSYGARDNHRTRWSFCVKNNPDFDSIGNRLLWSGLVIMNNDQYMLSNVGLRFCKKFSDRLNPEDCFM
jgi:hypothetical protein